MPAMRCGEVTLRPAAVTDDELLVALMPPDFDHDPTFPVKPGRSLQEHRAAWLRHWLHGFRHPWRAGDRYLVFVVEADGEPVGLQTLEGEDFAQTREVETTSFLTPAARGRRLGVAMRTAVLALAFDVLGAQRAMTSATPNNIASARVTERVGYTFLDRTEPVVAGQVRPLHRYVMTREDWAALDHLPVEIDGHLTWRDEP